MMVVHDELSMVEHSEASWRASMDSLAADMR